MIAIAWVLCFGVAVLGGEFASMAGCKLNEGGEYPCPVFGMDFGPFLSILLGLGLLAAFGSPLFVLAILGCLIVAGVRALVRRYRAGSVDE